MLVGPTFERAVDAAIFLDKRFPQETEIEFTDVRDSLGRILHVNFKEAVEADVEQAKNPWKPHVTTLTGHSIIIMRVAQPESVQHQSYIIVIN